MKCPDCDGMLVDVSLSGVDKSFRCFSCGGVFVMAKTINGLPSEDLSSQWTKVEVDPERLKTGNNKCPYDKKELEYYEGDLIQHDLKVRQCPECHWWWFPADSLFKFKPFQEKRIAEQAKNRPMLPMLMAALIPLLSLVLLVTGGIAGLNLLRKNQSVGVAAESKLRNVSGIVFGQEESVIYFSYEGELRDSVYIYLVDESKWVPVTVTKTTQGQYQISLGRVISVRPTMKIKVGGEEAEVVFRSVNP